MNEEIEYAEMLEIPVSTVNVVRKKRAKKRKAQTVSAATVETPAPAADLKESVIEKVNDKLSEADESVTADAQLFAESVNSEGSLDLGDIPDRIDTVRLYSEGEYERIRDELLQPQEYALSEEENANEGGMYTLNEETRAQKRVRICLGTEFALACALCGAIFFTNVFMPNSAINTFFRAIGSSSETTATVDDRDYGDFALSSVVSALSDAEVRLSETGVVTVSGESLVYPVCDGKVSEVSQAEDGSYVVTIAHSDSFSGTIEGLSVVYYAAGDEVYANIPVGYTSGEKDVQMTMYAGGERLDCFELTEENCLAWSEQD